MIIVNTIIDIIILYWIVQLNWKIVNLDRPAIVDQTKAKNQEKRLILFSLEIAERYTVIRDDSEIFVFDTSQGPIYFRGGTLPSGWETDTLIYIDKEERQHRINTLHNGVWMQSDHRGKDSFPTPCGYC